MQCKTFDSQIRNYKVFETHWEILVTELTEYKSTNWRLDNN